MILLALLIKGDFTEDSLTELTEHLVDAFLDVLAGFVRLVSNLLLDFLAAVFLCSSEVIDGLWLSSCQGIHKSLL